MSSPQRPGWQRNPIFKYFASVKLAMLLLGVLIVASIIGTLYESSFDAKIARAYVYGASWFNLWLALLAANLACAAFSRMPWKRHHTGFLITHLGIIILLIGSVVGRVWGIEGSVTLFKGEAPVNLLTVDEKLLQVRDAEGKIKLAPAEFLKRVPTPQKPRLLMETEGGLRVSAIGFSPNLNVALKTEAVAEGGLPALHFTITTAKMGQQLESWVLADHPEHGSFNMGLASIAFKRGTAPNLPAASAKQAVKKSSAEAQNMEEAVFAFEKIADQVTRAIKGGNTGVKVRLLPAENNAERLLTLTYGNAKTELKVGGNIGKTIPLKGTPFSVELREYWPDFLIRNGKPESVTQEPNNPAVLVILRGKAVPATPAPEAAQAPPPSDATPNSLTIYVSDSGALSYELSSRKNGASNGSLDLKQPLQTGWADWTLVADHYLPSAQAKYHARPAEAAAPAPMGKNQSEGVHVRVEQNNRSFEQWVPLGWQIPVPVQPKPIGLTYGYRQVALPISLQLTEFEVERNEGSQSPAGFKSTLLIRDIKGRSVTGQCWMNNPVSFPSSWLNTFSGLTYKLSQASWNPENLSQSSIQILRDPGWGFKWIGSLLIVVGIFTLFYLRPPRNFSTKPPNP